MDELKTGGSAFPIARRRDHETGEVTQWEELGMTLRDYFAGQAIQGFCANNSVWASNPMNGYDLVNNTIDGVVAEAYMIADAMLKAREGK